jgi:hypothetical protein
MNLEERIKALMEAKSQTAVELDEANKVKMSKDGDVEVDGEDDKDHKEPDEDDAGGPSDDDEDNEEDDEEDGEDDGKTDFSKDKKVVAKVNEDASNEKLKVGAGKKDQGGKLAPPPSSGDKQEDKGLNSKLKAGFGRKDGGGSSLGKASGQNDENKQNNVDQQSLPVKPFKVTFGESMEALFQGEELSEDFQAKAATIFESAVNTLVEQRVAELEEEFQVKLEEATSQMETQIEEAVEQVQDDLIENIDGFLNYAVGQWVEDNHVALESGIKVEMVTNFIDGLKTLFQENYIEVPEDKLDIVEAQAEKISELEEALVTVSDDHDRLTEEVVDLKKQSIIEHLAKGLTLKQKEKFGSLCEGLEYVSDEDYAEKAKTVKEAYFKDGKQEFVPEDKSTQLTEATNIDQYVKVLGGTLKFSK